MMMEKQVFVEGSLKHSLLTMLVLLPILAIVLFYFIQSILLSLFVTSALGLWYAGYQEERTITCDVDGCSIRTKNFWSSRAKTKHFLWRDVTDTKFIFTHSSESTDEVHFEVVAEGEAIEIIRSTSSTSNQDDNLITLVNEQSPHLPHIWIKDINNLKETEKVWRYSKIPRRQSLRKAAM